jgi:hypothetical protein
MDGHPFVDGRIYPTMCFVCYNTPKLSEYNEATGEFDRVYGQLHTPQEMVSDGFTKHEAERSIKALRKLLADPVVLAVPDIGVVVFSHLYLADEPLVIT